MKLLRVEFVNCYFKKRWVPESDVIWCYDFRVFFGIMLFGVEMLELTPHALT